MWPSTRSVEAYYRQIQSDDSLLDFLPKSYEIYHVTLDPTIKPDWADLVVVWQWKNAKQMTIRDVAGIYPYYLWDNETNLNVFKHLEELSFNVTPRSFNSLKIEPFFVDIQSLKTLNINVSTLDAPQIEKFINEQRGPAPTRMGGDVLVYTRPVKQNSMPIFERD